MHHVAGGRKLQQTHTGDIVAQLYQLVPRDIPLTSTTVCIVSWLLQAHMNQLDVQAGYGQGLPFPLGIVLPRIQQFHVRQTLRHTTPEQVSQMDLLLLVPMCP